MSLIGAIRIVGSGVIAVLQAGDAVITAIKGLRKMPRPKPVARPFPPPRKR